jgi:type III pantothenate kinase
VNLIIDIGNTHIKAALYNSELMDIKIYSNISEFLNDVEFYKSAKMALVASVTTTHDTLVNALKKYMEVLVFTNELPIPLKNKYKTQHTLGSDRLAAAIGAFALYPNKNVLVIDAGTCIKYNFINTSNEYLGGGISPGLNIRFKAMHHFTGRLPLVEKEEDFDKLIGETTTESLLSGTINGCVYEIEGMIEKYQQLFPDLTILITGGDASFLAKRLKNPIFAHPNLVLKGLNTVLNYYCESQKI